MGSANQRMKYRSRGQGDGGLREVAAIGVGRVNSFEIHLGAESAALGHWWGIKEMEMLRKNSRASVRKL